MMEMDASRVEAMIPKAGTPDFDMVLNRAGNRPSLAAARGISAQIMVQPLSAPKPEMMTTTAMRLPGQVPPNMLLRASEKGAVELANCDEGRMPNMAVRDSKYTTAVARGPLKRAFGTFL